MSNPNPLVPQGSLLEQQARSKSTFQMAAFIVALHVVVLGGFLFLGCKKEDGQVPAPASDTFAAPPPVLTDTNGLPPLDPFAAPVNTNASLPGAYSGVPPVTQAMPDAAIPAPFVPTPTPTLPTIAGGEHVVKSGEMAFVLAKKNGLTLKQLQEANPGKDLAKLKVGDKLTIPGATSAPTPTSKGNSNEGTAVATSSYTVKGGDNLSRLAKKFGTTVKSIREANGLASNEIKVGQKLKIPGKATASAAAPGPVTTPAPSVQPPTVIPGNPVVLPPQ